MRKPPNKSRLRTLGDVSEFIVDELRRQNPGAVSGDVPRPGRLALSGQFDVDALAATLVVASGWWK